MAYRVKVKYFIIFYYIKGCNSKNESTPVITLPFVVYLDSFLLLHPLSKKGEYFWNNLNNLLKFPKYFHLFKGENFFIG